MKIFKSIFRLDFPLAYKILDKLGEYLEIINDKTREKPFSAGKGNVNLLQHSLSHSAKVADDAFTLNLDLKTFNAVIEFQNGHDIDNLAKHPLFHFSDEVIEKLENEHSSKYERIGFRSHIIVQRDELNFSTLRDYIWNCNQIFGNPITDLFSKPHDIGVIFEAKKPDESESIRVHLGPYHEREQSKYFVLNHAVKEGLIFDIDIWQTNVSIPHLKLVELIRSHQLVYHELVKNIESQVLEVTS